MSVYMAAGTLEAPDGFLEGVGKIVSGMSYVAGVLTGRKHLNLRLLASIIPGWNMGT